MSDQFSRNFRNSQMAMNNQLKDIEGNATSAYNDRISKIMRKYNLEKEDVLDKFENLKERKEQATAILGTVGGLIENTVLSRHLIQSGVKNVIKSKKELLNSVKKQRSVDEDPTEPEEEPTYPLQPLGGEEGIAVEAPRPPSPIGGFADFGAETKGSIGAVPEFDFRDPIGQDSMFAKFSSGYGVIPPAPRFAEWRKGAPEGIKYKLSGDQLPTRGQRFQRFVKGIKSNIQEKFDNIKSKFTRGPPQEPQEALNPEIEKYEGTAATFRKFAEQREALAQRGDFTRGGGLAQKISSSGRRLRSDYYPDRLNIELGEVGDPLAQSRFEPSKIDFLGGKEDFSMRWDSRNINSIIPERPPVLDPTYKQFGAPYPLQQVQKPSIEYPTQEDPLLTRLKAIAPNPESGGVFEPTRAQALGNLELLGGGVEAPELPSLQKFSPSKIVPIDNFKKPSMNFGQYEEGLKPIVKGTPSIEGSIGTVVESTPIKEGVEAATTEAAEAAAEVGSDIGGKVLGATGALGEAGGLIGGAYGTYEAFKGSDVQSKGLAVGQDVLSAGGAVQRGRGIAASLKGTAEGAIDTAKESIADVGEGVGEGVSDIGKGIASGVGEVGELAADVGGTELAGLGVEASESVVPVVGEAAALATGIGFTIAGLVKGAVDLANQSVNPASKVEQNENRTLDTQQNTLNVGGKFVAPNAVSIYNQSQHFQGYS